MFIHCPQFYFGFWILGLYSLDFLGNFFSTLAAQSGQLPHDVAGELVVGKSFVANTPILVVEEQGERLTGYPISYFATIPQSTIWRW
jgi:hypothetical protein